MKPDNQTKVDRAFDFTIIETEERADGDGLNLEGYAAVFNSPTPINSWEGKFTESIAPGAFRQSIGDKTYTPIMQFNHGKDNGWLGQMPIGTVKSLKEDSHGLRVRARLLNSWVTSPVTEAIREGAITGMSFRFTVLDDEWSRDGSERTLKAVQLHELGPVVHPAYRDTSLSVRSSDDPVSQLVNLLKTDPDIRSALASELTFGGIEPLAVIGGVPELADGNEQTPDVSAVTEEQPSNDRRAELLELADFMERAALNRERSRLL